MSPPQGGLSRPLSSLLLAPLLLAVAIYFFARGLLLGGMGVWRFYATFGPQENFLNLSFWYFAGYTLLPFLANLVFNTVIGYRFNRVELPRPSAGKGWEWRDFRRLPWFVLFLLWWLLFNWPMLTQGDPVLNSLARQWPPATLQPRLRIELGLFHPMGNYGIFAGFALGAAWGQMRYVTGQKKKGKAEESGRGGRA